MYRLFKNNNNNKLFNQLSRRFATRSRAPFLARQDLFVERHIGPKDEDLPEMLEKVGVRSLDELVDNIVPKAIRSRQLNLGKERSESELLDEFKKMMQQNKLYRSHIGMGYYPTLTPNVLLRNMMENPGWYTPYTPYSAEISQGRLEMLLNFQTMITDLTGLDCANASLLDEATAAAEAVNMMWNVAGRKANKNVCIVSDEIHPQTLAVVKTRAYHAGYKVVLHPENDLDNIDYSNDDIMCVLAQYPTTTGSVRNLETVCQNAHNNGAYVVVATDLLALTVLKPPGEMGADVAFGSAQRFGVPMGYGGPHAAFMATSEQHKRKIPGRIIGVSIDVQEKPALRMAMQTREQHIRRDRATSNICTAQALLANMAAGYAVYHGPRRLKRIGTQVHVLAKVFANGMKSLGFTIVAKDFFDTVHVRVNNNADDFLNNAYKKQINLRKLDDNNITIAFDETNTGKEVEKLWEIFANTIDKNTNDLDIDEIYENTKHEVEIDDLKRTSAYLEHEIFNSYQSETEMMRYLFSLQTKDLSLQTAMIPLGSCTMKLNAASEMIPVTFPEVNNMHPFAPLDQTTGYQEMLKTLEDDLCEITGFYKVSMQPNAGSQGEYAGLVAIRGYHESRNESGRNICLIPASAHGTNPASAVMAGMKVVVVKCMKDGEIDMNDLENKVTKYSDTLSCIMVTYPSTYGVFDENIKDIVDLIHSNGGMVYMDGANMNAQVGLTNPDEIGADVCHLNLHKTFCIPHGGGGPGMGPIGVNKALAPFLPTHPFLSEKNNDSFNHTIAAAPYSSASILPISWMYCRLMGGRGLTYATKFAILNANYMMKLLENEYHVSFRGRNGYVAHEFILDLKPFKKSANITEEDIAKRLMDFNCHAPTMSWPVSGTIMIEPTESESLYELNRFVEALLVIRQEIREIEEGKADRKNNVLKNAPHTAEVCLRDDWNFPYSREKAAYPISYLKTSKFWPSVSRIDNVYGDRNLVCTCPPVSDYAN